jgi:tRNA threonylcarbamoyl adenosine modification protein YeaZ
MNILAFDTCLDKMYVTLDKNGNFSSKIIETTNEHYHSAFLISTIRDILKENDLTPQDIDVIATNIGPGSFTGIRACNTVARAFAQGISGNVKTIGVSSLEILSRINNAKQSLVALDARKNMAYVAVYENKKEIFAPKTVLIEDLKEMISNGCQIVTTDDNLAPVIGGISYQKTDEDLGKILIELAKEKLENVETDWRKLQPLYIQPPPVNN